MDIETRIELLEDDIRRQKDDLIRQEKKLLFHKRLWMGASCLLAGAIALGAVRPVPKEIVAERFMVKDASGNPRSTWAVSKTGEVTFGMMDGGKPRLAIGIRKKDVGMFISDSEGKIRLFAGMMKARSKKESVPMVGLFDKNGIPQVNMNAINRTGTHSLQVLDSAGNQRASFGLSKSQSPSLMMEDAEGRIRSMYGLTKEGEPRLYFFDEKNQAEWAAPPGAK